MCLFRFGEEKLGETKIRKKDLFFCFLTFRRGSAELNRNFESPS